MLTLQQAKADDLQNVIGIFAEAIDDMCRRGIFQWDEIYPSKETLQSDIKQNDLYVVCDDERIVGAVVLNDCQDEEYAKANWIYSEPAGVVHRLCIDPVCQHKGYGRQVMVLAHAMLMEKGYKSVRLDAFSQNPHALRLYESLGYRRAGEMNIRKGLFYLFEKRLL